MTTDAEGQPASRWYQRVLPVTAVAVVAVALLALVFPGFREQVALSATHEPEQYVALSFARGADGTVVVCTGSGAAVKVRFDVESHLAEGKELDYEIEVGDKRRTGTVRVERGETAKVTRAVPRPADAQFDVTVRLPGVDQQVLAHCDGARS